MRSRINTLEVVVEQLQKQVLDLERLLPKQIADICRKPDDASGTCQRHNEETEQVLRRQIADIDQKVDGVMNMCRPRNRDTDQTLRKQIAAVDVTQDVRRLDGEIRTNGY